MTSPTPEQIRTARHRRPRIYARDFAEEIGISEAELCAAFAGLSVTRISPRAEDILPHVTALGQVMALTRNDSCVVEKVSAYSDLLLGQNSVEVKGAGLEVHLLAETFCHAFALDEPGPKGPKRSLQIFDAAGEAIHKIHLRAESNHDAWEGVVAALRLEDQAQSLNTASTEAVANVWTRLIDLAHLRRGATGATRLHAGAVEKLLYRAAALGVPLTITAGNRGAIESHFGPIVRVLEAGPWINVLDPGLEMHLRMDHIAETWVTDLAQVFAFDAQGRLIARFAGLPEADEAWHQLIAERVAVSES